MLKKLTLSEIAENKLRGKIYRKRWLVFWIVAFVIAFWFVAYAKGVFDGAANCTIFESIC